MKKVNGGLVPPVCNVDNSCSVWVGGHVGGPTVGYLFGNCSTSPGGGCICSREYDGDIYYGNAGMCLGESAS